MLAKINAPLTHSQRPFDTPYMYINCLEDAFERTKMINYLGRLMELSCWLNKQANACDQQAICFHLSQQTESENKSSKRWFWLACEHRQILVGNFKSDLL